MRIAAYNKRFYEMAVVATQKRQCELATSQPVRNSEEAATS